MKKIFFLLTLIFINSNSFAESYFCKKDLESLPTLQGGRVKPLYVHASETIKNLTGKSTLGELSAVEAYCLLSLNGMGLPSDLLLEARIDHVDLMKFLGLAKDQHSISYQDLVQRQDAIKSEMRMIKDNESYSKAVQKLFSNISLYNEIKSGENWLLAANVGNQIEWQPLIVFLTEDKVVAQKAMTPTDPFLPVLLRTKTEYDRIAGNQKYELELIYAKAGLASWALSLTILALAAMVLFKNFNIALGLASLSAIVQLVLITL
ncbi:MAG: hypothetical protein EHM20_06505, partial [Alphaproteobacteria bacterium]